jgi:hypothetical protein
LPVPPPPPPPPSVATPLPPLKKSFVPAKAAKAEAENVPDSGQQVLDCLLSLLFALLFFVTMLLLLLLLL